MFFQMLKNHAVPSDPSIFANVSITMNVDVIRVNCHTCFVN